MAYQHYFVSNISDISEPEWQTVSGTHVFTSYAWLSALESSGCVSQETGWLPHHLIVKKNDIVVAILPGYLKSHSYGEYVFDWAFAEAYEQYGLEYYPKWLCGVPFTPVQGPRILSNRISPELLAYLQKALLNLSEQGLSGIHINFLSEFDRLKEAKLVPRRNIQFHFNNKKYKDFSDFLASLTARKRKMIIKERQKIKEQALSIKWFKGLEINTDLLDAFYLSYRLTYLKRSGHNGYLSKQFFATIIAHLPSAVRLCCAYNGTEVVATSLYFVSENMLFGRYWGAIDPDYDSLHFELCYYQGIELTISLQLTSFDAGAQGEHKLARGFEPVWRYSYHYLFNSDFHRALQDFTERESSALEIYFKDCESKLPFKHQ